MLLCYVHCYSAEYFFFPTQHFFLCRAYFFSVEQIFLSVEYSFFSALHFPSPPCFSCMLSTFLSCREDGIEETTRQSRNRSTEKKSARQKREKGRQSSSVCSRRALYVWTTLGNTEINDKIRIIFNYHTPVLYQCTVQSRISIMFKVSAVLLNASSAK